jgi:hypothetical protein
MGATLVFHEFQWSFHSLLHASPLAMPGQAWHGQLARLLNVCRASNVPGVRATDLCHDL